MNDLYLWVGAGLFAVSFIGVLWLIRLARKKQESEMVIPANYSDFFTPPPQERAAPAVPPVARDPFGMPAAGSAPTQQSAPMAASVAEPPRASLEILSAQLARIEEHLQWIAAKLDQPAPAQAGVSDEIKNLIQTIRPQAGKNDSAQISELSAKIEKIYQVLASISGSAR